MINLSIIFMIMVYILFFQASLPKSNPEPKQLPFELKNNQNLSFLSHNNNLENISAFNANLGLNIITS